VKINSRITLAGRTINDSMMDFAYNKIIKELKKYKNKKILICGLSYKENVSDIRNSLALKIFKKLKKNIPNIKGYDPIINTKLSLKNNVITAINKFNNFDVYVLITKHKKLQKLIKSLPKNKVILSIFD
jgi:UDP-N-acetyl-D-mannosaminuronate dehydrogenase